MSVSHPLTRGSRLTGLTSAGSWSPPRHLGRHPGHLAKKQPGQHITITTIRKNNAPAAIPPIRPGLRDFLVVPLPPLSGSGGGNGRGRVGDEASPRFPFLTPGFSSTETEEPGGVGCTGCPETMKRVQYGRHAAWQTRL